MDADSDHNCCNFYWETNENYVDWALIVKDKYTSGIWKPEKINNELD